MSDSIMSDTIENQIHALSSEELSPIASQVLGEDALTVGPLSVQKIGRSVGYATAGIYRVAGDARTATGERSWSTVAKALKTSIVATSKRDASRELVVYQSGIFANLSCVRSARFYALQPRNELQFLWLEDLSAAPQAPWLPQHYINTARHFGQFNAHWPEQSLPQWEWLQQMGVYTYFHSWGYEKSFPRFATQQEHPYMQLFAPGEIAMEVMRILEESDALYTLADATAKGICHWDSHPKNLFPMNDSGSSYTVAIDWDSVGSGPLGVDVGHLLTSPMIWLELSAREAGLLVEPVFDAYLAGLSDAGWSGNEESVRFTYLTRIVHDALRLASQVSNAAVDEAHVRRLQGLLGYSMEEICIQWGKEIELAIRYQDEAKQLAKRL